MYIVNEKIEQYVNNLTPELDGVLLEIQQEALSNNVPIIRKDVIRFLSTLLTSLRPKNILEVGTAVGFSACLFSNFLAENGRITTIERYHPMALKARENFEKFGVVDKVFLIENDAKEVLPYLTDTYDFIFLDGAKGQYIEFLPFLLNSLCVGGILIADNVLTKGNQALERENIEERQRTIHDKMNKFLAEVMNEKRLESSILPFADGLVFSVKTS